MDLNVLWFLLIGLLLGGYAVLDGFDLGVGILHPWVRGDRERRLVINSIGPLWDGNEVWLVTFGGALFAAFPEAYATVFSAFYLPFMALLAALIGRAISIEFRSKVAHPAWRAYWDFSFFLSSFVAVFIFGVAAGNMIEGIAVGADHEYQGSVLELFGIYPLAVGGLAVVAAAMHGTFYLQLKTEGDLQARIAQWRWPAFGIFLVAYVLVTIMTLVLVPRVVENFQRWPVTWAVVVLTVLAVASLPRAIVLDQPRRAFAGSCATILALVFTFGMALFPKLVISNLDPAGDLDIYAAASSASTLALMRNIAFLGLPFVLTYTGIVYWVFRGKTTLDEFSY
ncbi:MAG: cytochrome d ubiquinol oxidase subunit II [Myxococcota bacterium]